MPENQLKIRNEVIYERKKSKHMVISIHFERFCMHQLYGRYRWSFVKNGGSTECQPNQVAFASSLMMAFFNLGAFLCSSWESFLGSITGDSLYTPLYVGAVTFVFIAIVLFVKSPIPKEEK